MKRHLLLLWMLLLVLVLSAQPKNYKFVEDGDEHFKHNNFLSAIPIYKAELKREPDNIKVKYKLGICFLNTRLNRGQSIPLLEEASRDKGIEDEVWIHLGRAYHLQHRIEDATAAYEKYASLKPKRAAEVEHYLEQCKSASLLMQKPVKVSFQNLGKDVNSSEPDYYPFIDKDEMTLVFTTRRKENFGGKKIEVDGYRSSDIYLSKMGNGHWLEAKNIGRSVNGNLDEQVVGLRSDGLEMYMYLDHIDKFGNIYVSQRPDLKSDFLKPKILDAVINEEIETSGCISDDGSVIIFARRSGIKANSDLYIARKLPTGNGPCHRRYRM